MQIFNSLGLNNHPRDTTTALFSDITETMSIFSIQTFSFSQLLTNITACISHCFLLAKVSSDSAMANMTTTCKRTDPSQCTCIMDRLQVLARLVCAKKECMLSEKFSTASSTQKYCKSNESIRMVIVAESLCFANFCHQHCLTH